MQTCKKIWLRRLLYQVCITSKAECREERECCRERFNPQARCAEDVLKLIEDIKCDDGIPKNYGTLLDIMRKIRALPAADILEKTGLLSKSEEGKGH